MAEYIEKSDLYNKICERVNNPAIRSWLGSIINDIPAADVAPVVRGEWIEDDYAFNRCSECGYEYEYSEMKTPYCSNCGAKMEYEEDTI